MGQNIPVMDVVFIVVVPDIFVALLYQGLFYTVFPEGIGLRIGEIQIGGIAAPERKLRRRPVFVMQEPSVLGDFFVHRMIIQKSRFDIGKDP